MLGHAMRSGAAFLALCVVQSLPLGVFASAEISEGACARAWNEKQVELRELSAVIVEDLAWDIVRRAGNPSVCIGKGHRFFFVLLFYSHWSTSSPTADFGACVPAECDEAMVVNSLLPEMYAHFFLSHADYRPDGSLDQERSMRYSFTLKEYRRSITLTDDTLADVLGGAALVFAPGALATLLLGAAGVITAACPRSRKASQVETGRGGCGARLRWVLDAFELRAGCRSLTTPAPRESADLCRLRIGLTAALLTLHVTQGSKWRSVDHLDYM